jgi:hypothetical protein
MASNDTERKTTAAASTMPAYAPKRLSFWYRHGVFPHHLRGLGLVLTSMLWEQSLTPAEIDRTLREKKIQINANRLQNTLARLTRRGVLTRTGESYTANVYTGVFADIEFEDLLNLLQSGDAAGRMIYSNVPPMSVSSRGPSGG